MIHPIHEGDSSEKDFARVAMSNVEKNELFIRKNFMNSYSVYLWHEWLHVKWLVGFLSFYFQVKADCELHFHWFRLLIHFY